MKYQPDRAVPLTLRPSRPVVVYTDAADEGRRVRIGALVFDDAGIGHVLVYDVPDRLRAQWGTETAINQGELYAAPLTVMSLPEMLRDRDVLWFIDNTSAEAALVKAGSPTQSMCAMALTATAALAGIRARTWYDHVPSPDNPADPLSRGGLSDEGGSWRVAAGQYVVHEAIARRNPLRSSLQALSADSRRSGRCRDYPLRRPPPTRDAPQG